MSFGRKCECNAFVQVCKLNRRPLVCDGISVSTVSRNIFFVWLYHRSRPAFCTFRNGFLKHDGTPLVGGESDGEEVDVEQEQIVRQKKA